MPGLTCAKFRSLMQVADDLTSQDAALLHIHLNRCPACADLALEHHNVDHLLEDWLDRATDHRPVRHLVRARLAGQASMPQKRSWRAVPTGSFFRRAFLMVPVALAFTLVTLFVSQTVQTGEDVQTVGAAWHVRRPQIGFPLAVDPRRGDHLLAGASGHIYESRNAGQSWRPLASLPSTVVIRDLAIDAGRPNRYLVASKHSIFVSNDRGKDWAVAATSLPGAMNMFLLQDIHHPDTFYAGPSVLWRSTDHGNSWSRAGGGSVFAPDGIQSLAIAPDGSLVTGIWGGGVAISSNGGRTWNREPGVASRNVMNVTFDRNRTMWMASDKGVFFLRHPGERWRRASTPTRFFTTALLPVPTGILMGGDGFLYRANHSGTRSESSMKGLPLDPYVYSLLRDPRDSRRVYASLDSDGLFRSDDAGQHWTPIDAGIPLHASQTASRSVLFVRDGALWVTDTGGADPGVLTVDRDVSLAALSSDGAAAAYLAQTGTRWAVRVVQTAGSSATTLLDGSGPRPAQLLWSPTSTLLAVTTRGRVAVADLARVKRWLRIPESTHVLGWSADGSAVVTWDSRSDRLGRVTVRHAISNAISAPSRYPVSPVVSPDGRRLTFLLRDRLYVGKYGTPARAMASISPPCSAPVWSDDSMRLLLSCGHTVQERTSSGAVMAHMDISGHAAWAPGSHSNLLVSSSRSLWLWTPAHGIRRIVANARAAPFGH